MQGFDHAGHAHVDPNKARAAQQLQHRLARHVAVRSLDSEPRRERLLVEESGEVAALEVGEDLRSKELGFECFSVLDDVSKDWDLSVSVPLTRSARIEDLVF